VFPWIGAQPVSALTNELIVGVLERVAHRGAVESAHRIRQYIDSICRYAIQTGRLKANPTPHCDVLASPKKGRFASITNPKAAGALIRAIRGYQGTLVTQSALKLAPLVFVRPRELRSAEWSEFDLDAAEWRIPAAKMKMRSPHCVPLSAQAVTILRDIHRLTGSGRFVFPSERGRDRPMSANTINAALRVLGFAKDRMTAHGFRHMASTLLNESSLWKGDAIERQLAHVATDSVRGLYNCAEYLPERKKMMQWWADRLNSLAGAENVVSIKARG
jgi:integrase